MRYFSRDIFLFARCGIVIQGKEIYQSVLNNPNSFTNECTCEELLTISSEAYFLKVGKELNIALE
ncbi:DUF4240 domain-containing protein [Sporosarcina sp. P13]|uniref:DUF4240 domain-containing protein n=1 Tax=Sporosarcina sp. P13 TaxID=2048263 RepID=UPI003519CD11